MYLATGWYDLGGGALTEGHIVLYSPPLPPTQCPASIKCIIHYCLFVLACFYLIRAAVLGLSSKVHHNVKRLPTIIKDLGHRRCTHNQEIEVHMY